MERWGSVGVDLGGTKVLAVLFDERMRPIEQILERTRPEAGEARFSTMLAKAIGKLTAHARRQRRTLRAVGAGCAGFVDRRRGLLVDCPNIPFFDAYPLAAKLSALTGCPATLANDVQMGLYGELMLGAAIGRKDVIGLFLGTGIGGAVIIDGKLHLGSSGHAGEIGHYLLDSLGPFTGSQRTGLLDDVVSRHAIAAQAAAMAAKQWAPNLYRKVGADVLEIKAGDIADAIAKGDTKIEELMRSRSRIVGIVLSNLVNFLSPELVVLGGGLVKSLGEIIIPEVSRSMRRHALRQIARRVRVVEAELGDLAVAAGAARWALDKAGARERGA
jgi:glucokinase